MVTLEMGATAGSYTDYIKLFMNILTALVVAGSIFRAMLTGTSYLSGDQPLEEFIKKLKKIVKAGILCGCAFQIISVIAGAYATS